MASLRARHHRAPFPEQVYSGFAMANLLEFGTRSEVTVWGAGRKLRVGERTNLGIVIEVRPPLVKIQTESSGSPTEKWMRDADLSPSPQSVVQ